MDWYKCMVKNIMEGSKNFAISRKFKDDIVLPKRPVILSLNTPKGSLFLHCSKDKAALENRMIIITFKALFNNRFRNHSPAAIIEKWTSYGRFILQVFYRMFRYYTSRIEDIDNEELVDNEYINDMMRNIHY